MPRGDSRQSYVNVTVHWVHPIAAEIIQTSSLFQRCRNNVITVTGRNINYIENEVQDSSILTINVHKFKKNYKFSETKDEDAWKVCFVKEIVNLKQNVLHFDQDEEQFTEEELDELLDHLVTS